MMSHTAQLRGWCPECLVTSLVDTLYRIDNFGILKKPNGDAGIVSGVFPGFGKGELDKNIAQMSRLLTDYVFTCGANLVLRKATDAQKYAYYFTHPPSMDVLDSSPTSLCAVQDPFVGDAAQSVPPTKPCHAAELRYVWGNSLFRQNGVGTDKVCPADTGVGETGFCAIEDDIVLDMMSYWANFVKTGDPNGANLAEWPAFVTGDKDDPDANKYLELRAVNDPSVVGPSTDGPREIQAPFGPGYRNTTPLDGALCSSTWQQVPYTAGREPPEVGLNPIGFAKSDCTDHEKTK